MYTAPIVIEEKYNVPSAKIWKAITDREEMKEWYFDLKEFIAETGFEFEFAGGDEEGKQYLHKCRVMEVIGGRKLSYSWRYEGYEGNSLVTFELFPDGENTLLKLTHTGLETFPVNNPDFAKGNFEKGWSAILGTSLKEYLEKNS
jgi:uncharacterized protein YndB with AHSA1/START domain